LHSRIADGQLAARDELGDPERKPPIAVIEARYIILVATTMATR